jgi:hypothetical protein
MRELRTHRELCDNLAYAKNSIFVEIPLGSKLMQRPQIADVVVINPSYTKFSIAIYECKMTRSDLLGDLRREKWRGYLDHCNRFFFATKGELIDKKDIPKEAGLMVYNDKGWQLVKNAQNRKDVQIPEWTLLSMLFKKQTDPAGDRRHDIAHSYYGSTQKDYEYQLRHRISDEIKNLLSLKRNLGSQLHDLDVQKAITFYRNFWKDEEYKKAAEFYDKYKRFFLEYNGSNLWDELSKLRIENRKLHNILDFKETGT